jgi:holo-[acyl-carrier protein] synthase
VIALGTDILRVARIDEVVGRLGDRFVRRILTVSERLEYAASGQPNRLLAKRLPPRKLWQRPWVPGSGAASAGRISR